MCLNDAQVMHVFSQASLKQGLKKWGEDGKNVVKK